MKILDRLMVRYIYRQDILTVMIKVEYYIKQDCESAMKTSVTLISQECMNQLLSVLAQMLC